MKRAVRLALTHPFFVRAAFSLRSHIAPIFMLHRFRDLDGGNAGHDPDALRANLSWLRRNKCTLLSLGELLDRLEEGAPIGRAVAFSVDDGYADFARVAAPIFAEFDCPVTVFVTTGFLDGRLWMWWDQVTVALAAMGREADAPPMVESLKLVPEIEKAERIAKLIQASGAEIGRTPPERFSPISWNDVRRLTRYGVTFGPHSVTHPILSQAGDEESRFEVAESWRRVRAEAGAGATPIFCYPNGTPEDFSAREENWVAAEGMRAAVTTTPNYTSRDDFSAKRPMARFKLPRFGYAEERTSFIQIAGGMERAKDSVRAMIGHSLV